MNAVFLRNTGHSRLEAALARRATAIKGSPIDSSISLLQRQTHPIISFAMGCPAPEAIPTEPIKKISAEVLQADAAAALNYGPTEGERSLRKALLDWIPSALGQTIASEELLVTSGGMQGLDLVCKLFLDPGDLVVLEEPVYANSSMVIRSYEGELLPVPIDENGMQVELIPELVRAAGRAPKLINVIPNFQNPTGVTLSPARRRALLQLAENYGCVVLEDDPYGLLHFDRACPPSLRTMSGNSPLVIAVHTFSKILAPGLRVGWVAASPAIIARMIDARQGMDTCTNIIGQRIVAEFCRSGGLSDHIGALRHGYASRLAAMTEALEEAFSHDEGITWTEPEGGFFLWLTLPEEVDTERLFPIALAEGVAIVPGAAFSNRGQYWNAARLCFAYPHPSEMKVGIARLKSAIIRLPKRGCAS